VVAVLGVGAGEPSLERLVVHGQPERFWLTLEAERFGEHVDDRDHRDSGPLVRSGCPGRGGIWDVAYQVKQLGPGGCDQLDPVRPGGRAEVSQAPPGSTGS